MILGQSVQKLTMRKLLPKSNVFGARKQGQSEGDRLDVLATLIDVYETKHYPIDPPDPWRPSVSAWSSKG